MGASFDVKAQWTKCMSSWCPPMPLSGKQHISIDYSPHDSSSTKEIVIKAGYLESPVYSLTTARKLMTDY